MARKRRHGHKHDKRDEISSEEVADLSVESMPDDMEASKPDDDGPRHMVVNVKASSGTVEIVSDSSEGGNDLSADGMQFDAVTDRTDGDAGVDAASDVEAVIEDVDVSVSDITAEDGSVEGGVESELVDDGKDSVSDDVVPEAIGQFEPDVDDVLETGVDVFDDVMSEVHTMGASADDVEPCRGDVASLVDVEAVVSENGSEAVVGALADVAETFDDTLVDSSDFDGSDTDDFVVGDGDADEGSDLDVAVDVSPDDDDSDVDSDVAAVGGEYGGFMDGDLDGSLRVAGDLSVEDEGCDVGVADVSDGGNRDDSELDDAVDAIMRTMGSRGSAEADDVCETEPSDEGNIHVESVDDDVSLDVAETDVEGESSSAAEPSDFSSGSGLGPESDSHDGELDGTPADAKVRKLPKVVSSKVCAIVAAGMLGVGLLVGGAVVSGSSSVKSVSVVSVDKDSLGDSVCRVSWRGHSEDLTVEDVLLANGSALSSSGADSYEVPSTETIVAVARSRVLAMAAAEEGISVTDEDVKNYVIDTLNVPDIKSATDTYGMTEDELVRLARNSVITDRLREHVLEKNGVTSSEPPVAPEPPAKGAEGKPSKAYYDYIVGLVGKDGVSESGEVTDKEYASVLKGMTVNAKDGATFEAAQLAYDVALKSYASNMPSEDVWSDYRKDILKDGAIEVRTLTW